jgi:hypothetical protein
MSQDVVFQPAAIPSGVSSAPFPALSPFLGVDIPKETFSFWQVYELFQ